MKKYETIIIGAGIAGIGCAYKLLENNYTNFKIISPDIGGRIIESDSGTVEYGAYYVMDIYHNMSAHIEKGREIKPTSLMFHKKNQSYSVFNKRLFSKLPELIRLVFILRKFKKHYEKFKKDCLHEAQLSLLRKNEYLWDLYNISAGEYIKREKIDSIMYDFMAEVLHGSAFTPIKNLNAFTLLHFSLPLIVSIHEFVFRKKEVSKYLENNYIDDVVLKINKGSNGFELKLKSGENLVCDKLVIASPPQITKELLHLKVETRGPVSAHMFHMLGEVREEWNEKDYNLFEDDNRILAIAHQRDNSYLFYSVDEKPNFDKYFYEYKILKHKYWDPAFCVEGHNTIDFEKEENMYIIGDNNVCGIEPTYIYGQYCGNKILGKTID
ncbi:hypothetical protein C0584_03355 [Candidatus Parcubacteria bacterium]|nr:MAG: hypothetical protein C0584_03355 [Candidatus Parcubacteria bacterium]